MSFGSFFTRALDILTPWNRGGEVQRTIQRRRRPEDQNNGPQISSSPVSPQISSGQQQPRPLQPTNIFDTLNKNLVFNKPQTAVPVVNNQNNQPVQPPKPGLVVRPTIRTPEDHINEGLNAGKSWEQISHETNIPLESVRNYSQRTRPNYGIAAYKHPSLLRQIRDTAAGTIANIPEVGLATGRAATGIVQGVADLPHAVTATVATGTQQLQKHLNNPITRQINRGFQDVNTGVKQATHYAVNDAIDPLNRRLDEAAKLYERKVPGAVAGSKVYRNTQIPINALAVLATLGAGSEGSVGAVGEDASRLSRIKSAVSNFLNKPLTSNEDNLISKTGQRVVSKARPVVEALNTPIKSTRQGVNVVRGLLGNRSVQGAERGAVDAGEIGNLLTDAQATDLATTKVPVGTGVPVQTPESVGQPIRVRNLNEPKPLIRELGGDARSTTPDALARHEADQARLRAAELANRTVPDNRIEGVTPRPNPNERFKLDPAEIEKTQKKIVQEYADTLQSQGEGNGVSITPDGRRLSNNVRAAETAGKKMTKAQWRDEAQRQLEAGKAEPGHQGAFNDAANPDVQSQLAQGERPNAPEGRPIAVKQATGIAVRDETNVPQNLPETPGKVRVTANTEPVKAKSEAVAAQATPVTVPKAVHDMTEAELLARDEQIGKKFESIPGTMEGPSDAKTFVPAKGYENQYTQLQREAQDTAQQINHLRNPDQYHPAPRRGETAPAVATETLPKPNETDETFLKRAAEDMQTNIQRAVDSLKMTKKMTKAERAQRAAAGQKAYEEAKAAGKSIGEQEAARKAAYSGGFGRMDYQGTPIHSADEQRLRDMVDEHYKDMPYQAGNVREAFSKLFHAGEPGWQSEAGNHIIPSDIKNIRKFLNESVPNPDGNGGLGDFADSALKELASQETGPGRLANAIGLQRALRFTADISATGRQALPGALSHPVEFAKAAAKSFEVMFSHEKYQKLVSELANNKEANYINDRLGAYLSVLNDDISKADDIYRNSGWAHKIPIVRPIVAASERQYNTILSMMRYYGGKRFIDAAGGIGNLEKIASDSGNPETFLKAIGTVTNVNTGRGFGKALDTGASKVLSDLLVSPRGLAAKVQRFNPKYYIDLARSNPAAAKEAIRSLGIQTAVTLSALKAASAAGIYEDGQIKVGNTRYDITGGAANMIRTAVRIVQFISGDRATTGRDNAENELYKWGRNQVAPFLATALDTIGIHPDKKTGEWVNRFGDKVTLGSEILNNITPINASQINSDLQLQTPPDQTAINAVLNTLGIGVNTYQSAADKKAAAAGPSNSAGADKSKFGQATDSASFKAQAPEKGYNLQQLDDGSYSYSINGEPHNVDSLEKAQQAIAKDSIENSDKSYKIIGDKVYRKDADGKVGKPISKTAFDYQLDAATLTAQKKADDLAGWTKTANKQIDRIEKQLQDPNIDPLDAQKLRNQEQTLVDDMAKYKKYGGFKKGSGGGRRGIDTSFGTLKAGYGAPSVQQYDTIDTKSGNVPHISVVRPNIVHKITAG